MLFLGKNGTHTYTHTHEHPVIILDVNSDDMFTNICI